VFGVCFGVYSVGVCELFMYGVISECVFIVCMLCVCGKFRCVFDLLVWVCGLFRYVCVLFFVWYTRWYV